MRMVDLIQKKKQGEALTREELEFIVQGYTREEIPDYQMSAFLMAVYFRGMSMQETADLTLAFVNSGDSLDLSAIDGVKVDKHSTGGVGDKVSLIAIPLVAAAGIPVAKMSGRGLGHTGGTIDKLESIEGFRIELGMEEFISNVNRYKMAIVGQSANLTPADKKIYALRDVTATVDSIPLIASSIMSKKIASGADAIVLDVKVGSGAFMKDLETSRKLAEAMVAIGKSLNRKTIAVLTDMNQPLGHEIGNANEVAEAIEVLQGNGPEDLKIVALTIASHMTVLGGAYPDPDTAYRELEKIIASCKAFEKFRQLVAIQGGNVDMIDDPGKLPKAGRHVPIKAEKSGYIAGINAESIGIGAMMAGAGRKKKGDAIDYSAGVTIYRKIGDKVEAGDTICVLHSNMENTGEAEKLIRSAYIISQSKPDKVKLIHAVIK